MFTRSWRSRSRFRFRRAEVAVGVPADVVRRRPDIRRAERELAAQTARVGVATANLYPRLTLNGSVGLETLSLGDSSSAVPGSVSGGPRLPSAIFDTTIRPNIEVQSALQEQALLQYETVSSARWRRWRTPWWRTPRNSSEERICRRQRRRPRRRRPGAVQVPDRSDGLHHGPDCGALAPVVPGSVEPERRGRDVQRDPALQGPGRRMDRDGGRGGDAEGRGTALRGTWRNQ